MRLTVAAMAALVLLATVLLPLDVFVTDDSVHRSATLAGAWRSAAEYNDKKLCVSHFPLSDPFPLEPWAKMEWHESVTGCWMLVWRVL